MLPTPDGGGGGGEKKGMDPAKVQDVVSRLGKAKADLQHAKQDADQAAHKLASAWHGPDSNRFQSSGRRTPTTSTSRPGRHGDAQASAGRGGRAEGRLALRPPTPAAALVQEPRAAPGVTSIRPAYLEPPRAHRGTIRKGRAAWAATTRRAWRTRRFVPSPNSCPGCSMT